MRYSRPAKCRGKREAHCAISQPMLLNFFLFRLTEVALTTREISPFFLSKGVDQPVFPRNEISLVLWKGNFRQGK